eukprot:Gregarina_sp_Pseudo_9__835@NODE_1534_length_1512_cov_105_738629_g1421_i0_p1_GENE_NODE_1534_length_1512_cov_105_738629_g1421_i0NODE_1534_length_1512_cov_105_738629_g1421_i0_p1_ORF_typecomplete_len212_score32_57Clat_adaptor_s/PF01217_20/7e22AP5_subunit_s1/PF15001_6/0_083DUF924/PF06041_11/0_29_NODE_1534_length_1512_cov_105_738629_g1421_i07811416
MAVLEDSFGGVGSSDSLTQILAILILNDRAERLVTRYTPSAFLHAAFATHTLQRQFEEQLLDKTQKQGARSGQVEVVIHKDYLTLYRSVNDLHFVVIGDPSENEILLLDVINALYNSLNQVTCNRLTHDVLACKLDMALLVVDEIIEGSIIFEVDPSLVTSRAEMNETVMPAAGGARSALNTAMDNSTAFNQALNAAKEGILKGFFGAVAL